MNDAKFEENMRNLRDSIIFGRFTEFKRIMSREYVEKEGTYEGLGWVHWAVRFQRKQILDYLLKFAKLDVNLTDGWTPLHVASSLGYKEFVEILLKAGADKGKQSKDGFYPAQVAVNKEVERLIGYPSGPDDPTESWLCSTFEKDQKSLRRREENRKARLIKEIEKRRKEKKKRKAKKDAESKSSAKVDADDQPDFDDDGFMTL